MEDAALVERVQELVANILSETSFAGKDDLVAQVPRLRIGDGPITFLRLIVARDETRRSPFERGHTPGTAWVYGTDGSPIGTMFVWVEDGYIAALEYAWVTDEPPVTLPEVGQIRLGKS